MVARELYPLLSGDGVLSTSPEPSPVRGPESIESHPAMIWIGGKRFTCRCRVNVFTARGNDRFTCNGCGAEYVGRRSES